jgi:predicted RNA-binding protein YlqC (UPF0109 family)
VTHEDERADLISRLLEALIDNPRELNLDAMPLEGRVNWWVKVNISDTGRIVGKQGAHMNALKVLVAAMGRRYEEDWRFEMNEPDPGERHDKPRVAQPRTYNSSDASLLLAELVRAILGHTPHIIVRDAHPDYTWSIEAEAVQDYETLVTAMPVMGRPDLAPIQPVAALGTLWRAYGRQHGVNFKVEVPAR